MSASARFITIAFVSGKQIPIYAADLLRQGGHWRVMDKMNPYLLHATVEKVKAALQNNVPRVLSAGQVAGTSYIVMTSMEHTTSEHRHEHISFVAFDIEGKKMATGIVTTDKSKQELARSVSEP